MTVLALRQGDFAHWERRDSLFKVPSPHRCYTRSTILKLALMAVLPPTNCARSLDWLCSGLWRLEREAGAQLEFAARGHGHRDGAELGGVHEAVRSAQVDHV